MTQNLLKELCIVNFIKLLTEYNSSLFAFEMPTKQGRQLGVFRKFFCNRATKIFQRRKVVGCFSLELGELLLKFQNFKNVTICLFNSEACFNVDCKSRLFLNFIYIFIIHAQTTTNTLNNTSSKPWFVFK